MFAVTHVVQVDPALLTKLVGIIIPIIVAFLARSTASRVLKTTLNAVLAVVAGGLVTAITAKGSVNLAVILDGSMWAAITAWASYTGLWKPSGVAPAIMEKTPGLVG